MVSEFELEKLRVGLSDSEDLPQKLVTEAMVSIMDFNGRNEHRGIFALEHGV